MCFTPTISFTIFAIEWILGIIVLSKRERALARIKRVYLLSALLLFFLGAYQFTQGMFCTSGDVELWGKMGFLAYTFLPAMGLHLAYSIVGKKRSIGSLLGVYLIPVLFSLWVLAIPQFVVRAECSRYFIIAEQSWSMFGSWGMFGSAVYSVYYFLFIILTALEFFEAIKREKSRYWKKVLMAGFSGIMAFTVPTFILVILLPALRVAFPSILCEFALLFAIFLFYMIYLLEKGQKRQKRK